MKWKMVGTYMHPGCCGGHGTAENMVSRNSGLILQVGGCGQGWYNSHTKLCNSIKLEGRLI